MIKKNIGVQITVFIALSGILWFAGDHLITNNTLINAVIKSQKIFFKLGAAFLWIPVLTNVFLQVFSKNEEYDENKYYSITKSTIHYSLLFMTEAVIFGISNLIILSFFSGTFAYVVAFLIALEIILVIKIYSREKYNFDIFNWNKY